MAHLEDVWCNLKIDVIAGQARRDFFGFVLTFSNYLGGVNFIQKMSIFRDSSAVFVAIALLLLRKRASIDEKFPDFLKRKHPPI